MDATDGPARAFQNLLRTAFGGVLEPAGFVPARRRRVWVRRAGEVEHVVEVTKRYGRYSVQRALVCPELVDVIYGTPYIPFDVAWSVVTGYPGSIRHPAKVAQFSEAEVADEYDRIATGVQEDLRIVEAWMRQFATRAAIRKALLQPRGPDERKPWVLPGSSRLTLFHAAALAAADRDPSACQLIADTLRDLATFNGDITRGRRARLHRLADGMCEGLPKRETDA